MAPGRAPTRKIEQEMWAEGYETVVGIDEVGRGAWAGPLVVGAAILPREKRVLGVRDSKMLTERERERLFDRIADWCDAWSVGAASQEECDELGMAEAQRLACRRAIDALGVDARRRGQRRQVELRLAHRGQASRCGSRPTDTV